MTNFRNPATRLLSLYNYYRLNVVLPDDAAQLDALYPVAFAQDVDFHSFIATDDPRIEIHTRNFHTRQLTNSAWCPGSEGDLAHAIGLIDRMPWFYVCEQPEASMRWGRHAFGGRLLPIERHNVTGAGDHRMAALTAVAPETQRLIAEKNALDIALYAHATQRLLALAG